MFNMFLSVLCCAADNLFSIFVVNVQVSVPCVIAGRVHWLKTFLLKYVGSVPFISVLCLPNACHFIIGHNTLIVTFFCDFFPMTLLPATFLGGVGGVEVAVILQAKRYYLTFSRSVKKTCDELLIL